MAVEETELRGNLEHLVNERPKQFAVQQAGCSTHGTLNHPAVKSEQNSPSFRYSLHHILQTTGLIRGVGVCCSEGTKNEKSYKKIEEVFLWHIKLVDYIPCD